MVPKKPLNIFGLRYCGILRWKKLRPFRLLSCFQKCMCSEILHLRTQACGPQSQLVSCYLDEQRTGWHWQVQTRKTGITQILHNTLILKDRQGHSLWKRSWKKCTNSGSHLIWQTKLWSDFFVSRELRLKEWSLKLACLRILTLALVTWVWGSINLKV